MGLNEMEKRLLFQVEGDYQFKVLNELYMTAQYTKNPEQRKAAENLMAKLRGLTDTECMDIVRDIQKNYRLPYPARTIGEKIAEARQKSGAKKLKGHDIMALERFDPEVRHMIVFDVLSY
ncbi:MAG: addiction module toxin RelE, partial [Ruminococcus sp.]|nr:addiction module toxin RelE [Ruminococcus sp.]